MRYSLGTLIAMVLWLAACQEPIEIDLPEEESKIVVNSNFSPDDFIRVFLSKERRINSPDTTVYLSDARIQIYLKDLLIEELSPVLPNGEYPNVPYFQSSFRPKEGRTYRLELEIENNPKIRAVNTVPDAVEIQTVFAETPRIDSVFQDRINVLYTFEGYIEIRDPASIRNYYHMAELLVPVDWFSIEQGDTCCIQPNKEWYLVPITLPETQDPAFLSLEQETGYLCDDGNFDGELKQLPFRASLAINTGFQRVSRLYVLLRSVSADYYLYHSSFTRQLAARESPFAEPVIIYNNIENGLGNFSSYSTTLDSVVVLR